MHIFYINPHKRHTTLKTCFGTLSLTFTIRMLPWNVFWVSDKNVKSLCKQLFCTLTVTLIAIVGQVIFDIFRHTTFGFSFVCWKVDLYNRSHLIMKLCLFNLKSLLKLANDYHCVLSRKDDLSENWITTWNFYFTKIYNQHEKFNGFAGRFLCWRLKFRHSRHYNALYVQFTMWYGVVPYIPMTGTMVSTLKTQ